ncbi:UPF0481 protein At3g47200 [Quercus suber]|uniref:UPF0481 protein At3g47200 n=1 Tax=Quercus suber TaxID=58331 RepID=UPI000CE28693|nr:UPF0481 protein At3g47200-like [Quercus suber]POE70216.1 upf0481 protein [Quercus suber]
MEGAQVNVSSNVARRSEESEASPRVQTPAEQNSEGETRTDVMLEINDTEGQEQEEPLISREWSWTIFRVPAHVREVDEGAYNPKIVSIGPFHHNEPGLRSAMEVQKQRILNRLLDRTRQLNLEMCLENAMRELEGKTRECYSEHFEGINSAGFVQMMVLDGCFIVELLRLYGKTYKGKRVVKEPIFETRWMLPTIARDLLMLENQLPLFVLQKIFELTTFKRKFTPLNKLALRFFEPLRIGRGKLAKNISNKRGEYPHLLALFHSTFIPSDHKYQSLPIKKVRWNQYDNVPGKGWVQNAKSLHSAGITFRKKTSNNLLDIKFESEELMIPTLFIDDGTGPLLRNLIAFEQSNRYVAPFFSCLAVFLSCLVDTTDDINILRNAGIIIQVKGGNEEVVNLLNSLNKELEIDMDDCCITKQIEDINRYYKSTRAKIISIVKIVMTKINFVNIVLSYLSFLQTTSSSLFRTSNDDSLAPSPSPF